MHLAELSSKYKKDCEINSQFTVQQNISKFVSLYSDEQIAAMPFWLENTKKDYTFPVRNLEFDFCKSKLNKEQLFAYNIVENHFNNNVSKPLRMILTGQGGSGKSFLINGFRNLFGQKCIVLSYFGIAAFKVKGETLHSFFQLPIHRKNSVVLKSNSLQKLQKKYKA